MKLTFRFAASAGCRAEKVYVKPGNQYCVSSYSQEFVSELKETGVALNTVEAVEALPVRT